MASAAAALPSEHLYQQLADEMASQIEAGRLRPATVVWSWIPREANKAADTLVNRALDGDPLPRKPIAGRGSD